MINCSLGQSTSNVGLIVRASVLASGIFVSSVFAQADQNTNQSFKEVEDLPVTVQPGDSFTSIISRELMSLDAWGEIAKYNNLTSPDTIKPGDIIVIPGEFLRLRDYATVVFVKGKALHLDSSNNEKINVEKGDRIYSGDLIETEKDGFVSVSFNGGSSVNIQPESKMRISVLKCVDREIACEVSLESSKGQLGLAVESVGFKEPTVFSITSPYATAAVRGTRFDFDIDDGNILGVTEGRVEISINGVSNNIKVGKGVLAGEGKSIGDLYDLIPQPSLILRDDINRISNEDIINWKPAEGATQYLVAYASDGAMREMISSSSRPAIFTKPELPLGESFISVRAVAANGLRGFTKKSGFLTVDIDEASEATILDITLTEEDEMRVTALGEAGDDIEVKIGNALEDIKGKGYIVAEQVIHMKGGETQTIQIDSKLDWYLQSRKVLDPNTVSPYGLLYLYEKIDG